MYVACLCLACLLSVVIYGVVLRYVFNDAPAYVEQVALILVISVAMFGAAAGVRLRPISGPWSFFRRVRLMAGGSILDNIDYYNRTCGVMHTARA